MEQTLKGAVKVYQDLQGQFAEIRDLSDRNLQILKEALADIGAKTVVIRRHCTNMAQLDTVYHYQEQTYTLCNFWWIGDLARNLTRLAEDLAMAYYTTHGGDRDRFPNTMSLMQTVRDILLGSR